jgi:hypothetical protein
LKALLLLITMAVSVNSYALVCTSEDNIAKKLELTNKTNNLVVGESYIRAHGNVFAGTVDHGFFKGSTYTLFNQDGQEFIFFLKNELVFNHCRARFCPPPAPIGPKQGKLTSEGIEDEYFSCL